MCRATQDCRTCPRQSGRALARQSERHAATIANHTERVAWARTALKQPHTAALEMSAGVILNPTIQAGLLDADPATPSDNDVQYVVNGLVDAFALAA